MSHYAIMSARVKGRAYPMIAIGCELLERGHRVTFIGFAPMRSLVEDAGLTFIELESPTVALSKQTMGSILTKSAARAFRLLGPRDYEDSRGLGSVAIAAQSYSRWTRMDLACGETVLREIDCDALIASDTSYAAGTLAEAQGLPFYSVCTGIPIIDDSSIPPWHVDWDYDPSLRNVVRYRLGNAALKFLDLPVLATLNEWRRAHGMSRLTSLGQTVSSDLYISQLPEGMDFVSPENRGFVKYVGALTRPGSRGAVAFPWNRIGKRPLVYASTGTIAKGEQIMRSIAEACSELPVDLVITRGGTDMLRDADTLPGNPIVLDYCPQTEVLKHASLTVTHGSTNTIAESIEHGVPLIVVPQLLDQPGGSARVTSSGSGLAISPKQATSLRIKEAIKQILGNPEYATNARRLRDNMPAAGGTAYAAHLIEAAGDQTEDPSAITVKLSDGYVLRGSRIAPEKNVSPVGTVLCINGFGTDSTATELIASHLRAGGCDVISVDMRGHGLSARDDDPGEWDNPNKRKKVREHARWLVNPSQLAADLMELAERLRVTGAALVSQSYGGIVGLELLRIDPHRHRFKQLFAFAPTYIAWSIPRNGLPRRFLNACRLILRVAIYAGIPMKRELFRKQYTHYEGAPHLYIPMMAAECRNLSFPVYARTFFSLCMSPFRRPHNWTEAKDLPVRLFAARDDRLWDNSQLEATAQRTGWPLEWFDCSHIGTATSNEYAASFADAILKGLTEPHELR